MLFSTKLILKLRLLFGPGSFEDRKERLFIADVGLSWPQMDC